MTFGKPKLSGKMVRCVNCGDEYQEHEIILKHAGRTEEGDYWNDKCPTCGAFNAHIDSGDLSDEEFREKQHEIERQRREHRRKQEERRK